MSSLFLVISSLFLQISNRAQKTDILDTMSSMTVSPPQPFYDTGVLTEFRTNITLSSFTSNKRKGECVGEKGRATVCAVMIGSYFTQITVNLFVYTLCFLSSALIL